MIGLAYLAEKHELRVWRIYGRFAIDAGGGKCEVLYVSRTCGYNLDGRWTLKDFVLARGAAAYHMAKANGDLYFRRARSPK